MLESIEMIYDAAANPALWPQALSVVAKALKSKGALLIWQKDDGNFGTIASPGIQQAQLDYVSQGWLANDIRAIRSIERGYFFSGEPFGDLHVCSQEEIGSHPFYKNFLARHGLGWFGGVAVSPDRHTAVALSVQRSPQDSTPFDENELKSIARLGRYVEKSLRLSIQLMDAQIVKAGFSEALARVGLATFVLDASGRVAFTNLAAEKVLGHGVLLADGKLVASSSASRLEFSEIISAAVRADPKDLLSDPRPCLLLRDPTKRPLVAYVISLKGSDVLSSLHSARAIVFLIDPAIDEPVDPAIVRDFLGLSLGEARIASLVGVGLSPKDVSERLGIAEGTVRSLLKKVFSKTGVRRQPELVALLTKLVVSRVD